MIIVNSYTILLLVDRMMQNAQKKHPCTVVTSVDKIDRGPRRSETRPKSDVAETSKETRVAQVHIEAG